MKSKVRSTFEQFMSNPEQKEIFEKEYAQFLFSELLLEAMEEEKISVRKLSQESGVSTSIIQNIRALKPVNMTLKTMASLLAPLGYELTAKKGRKVFRLT